MKPNENLTPIRDWLIFEREEAPKQIGLIIVPDTAEQKVAKAGRVVAVGPGRWRASGHFEATEVQVGDRVLFDQLADVRCIDAKRNLWAGAEYQLSAILDVEE